MRYSDHVAHLLTLRGRADHRVLLLPHYRLRGRLLYSCLSDAPAELSPTQARLLRRSDGRRTLAGIVSTSRDAQAALLLLRAAVITTIPPRRTKEPRERWLVFSPHRDDAAISIGGWLARACTTARIVVANLVTRSNSISVHIRGGQVRGEPRVSKWRQIEDELAASILGVELEKGFLRDAPLRPPGGDYFGAFVAATHRLFSRVKPVHVVAPLGLGHSDHRFTHEAVIHNLSRWATEPRSLSISFYEDLPYAFDNPREMAVRLRQLRSNIGRPLVPHLIDIRSTMPVKLSAVAAYRSQEILEDFGAGLLSYAGVLGRMRPAAPGWPCERIWEMKGLDTSRGSASNDPSSSRWRHGQFRARAGSSSDG